MSDTKRVLDGTKLVDVPDEIFLEHIFQLVLDDKSDILSLRLVCKKFNLVLQNEYLLKRVCMNKWDEPFVIHLPSSIMKKYYDDSFRKMFILNNKYRYCHYVASKSHGFGSAERIREYDRNNGTDIENQLIQGVCVVDLGFGEGMKVNDFYSKDRFRFGDNNTLLTLEKIFGEDECEEHEFYMEAPGLISFYPLLEPVEEFEYGVDKRFPVFRLIYYEGAGNVQGNLYEGNSKKYLCSLWDSEMSFGDYEGDIHRLTHRTEGGDYKIPKDLKLKSEREKAHHKPLCDSFKLLFQYQNFGDFFNSESHKYLPMTYSLEVFRRKNEDKLEYSNVPVYRLVTTTKRFLIAHIVNNTKKWNDDHETMVGITRNFGNQPKLDYEKPNEPLYLGKCIFSQKNTAVVCSMVCVQIIEGYGKCFQSNSSVRCLREVEKYCEMEGIEEVHFQNPQKGEVWEMNYNKKEVRKELNRLFKDDGIKKIVFHDKDFKGAKEIYEDISWMH